MTDMSNRNDAANSLAIVYNAYKSLSRGIAVQPDQHEVLRHALMVTAESLFDMRKQNPLEKAILFPGLDDDQPLLAVGLGVVFEAMAFVAKHFGDIELCIACNKESLAYELKHGEPLGVVTALSNITVCYITKRDFQEAEHALTLVERYVDENRKYFPLGLSRIVRLRELYEEHIAGHQ